MGFLWEPKNTSNEQMAPSHSMSSSLPFAGCLAAIFLEEKQQQKLESIEYMK